MARVFDALGRNVELAGPARRIVSLVPSETASVCALGAADALVGRTDYCELPHDVVARLPSVGGTKKFDVGAVRALRPDLVLANKEENARPLVEQLIAAGLTVHVSFPCDVASSLAYVESLARLLGREATFDALRRRHDGLWTLPGSPPRAAFVPIWSEPLMTFDSRVFASDLLAHCGLVNVFGRRRRRYPLGADLGHRPELPPERTADLDTRYPRIRPDEIVERGPEVIMLPDEPHAFTAEEVAAFAALDTPASRAGALFPVSGKDLFWYGTFMFEALPRLRALLASKLRPLDG